MYVCICNCIREKQVETAIADGACSVNDTFRKLGCQPRCGQCVPIIRDTLESVFEMTK